VALIDLWKSNEDGIRSKGIRQILAFAGEGHLADGNRCSKQFRDLLAILSIWELRRVADDLCAKAEEEKTPVAALALQDLVNALGSRLGYAVAHGVYRGRRDRSNQDGLWTDPDGRAIVVEVKTSSTYAVRLETLARYRGRLIDEGRIAGPASMLIVVCRDEDTEDLESQIRGSRYSWDVRLISLKGLIRLAEIKLSTDDPKSAGLLRDVLAPEEYTKVDRLLHLVGYVMDDVTDAFGEEPDDEPRRRPGAYVSKLDLPALRAEAVTFLKKKARVDVKEVSRSLFESLDGGTGFYFAASKRYPRAARDAYWFALHDHQTKFLRERASAHLLFWCAERGWLFIPRDQFAPFVARLRGTAIKGRVWKHVTLLWDESGKVELTLAGRRSADVSRWATPF